MGALEHDTYLIVSLSKPSSSSLRTFSSCRRSSDSKDKWRRHFCRKLAITSFLLKKGYSTLIWFWKASKALNSVFSHVLTPIQKTDTTSNLAYFVWILKINWPKIFSIYLGGKKPQNRELLMKFSLLNWWHLRRFSLALLRASKLPWAMQF